jgi:hypothetical protein
MKSKILLLCLVFLTSMASAQSYFILKKTGTNSEKEGNYVFTTLGSMLIQGNATGLGDTLSGWQSLPFSWNFYGKAVTGYRVSDNGYIIFDNLANVSNPSNIALPDTNAPKNAIFAFWDSLSTVDPDGQSSYTNLIHTWTYGTAPNRVHVIHWFRSFHSPYTSANASQFCFGIRIYESGPKAFDLVYDYRFLPSGGTIAYTSATAGCQNNDGTAATMVTGSPSFVYPALSADKADDVLYEFYYGVQPALDLSAVKLNITDMTKIATPLLVKGTVRNMGSDVVNYFTLNYRVDGGTVVSQVISGANIAPGSYYDFSHPDIWTTSSTEKTSIIEVWTSLLNGSADQNSVNDSIQASVQILPNSAVRLPLHEVFTSSTCPPCNPGNVKLQSILDVNQDKYTCVKYQEHWPEPGDPYYTKEVGDRATYYSGINSVPNMFVDGGWGSNPSSYSQTLLDQFYNVPSFVSIDANYNVVPASDPTDTTVKVDISFTPMADFIGYSPKLYIAIVERVTSRNVKTNGETEFFWVMKKMIPNASGIAIGTMSRGTKQDFTRSYTFRGKYRLQPDAHNNPISLLSENSVEDYNNLAVVVWIQDDLTLKVLQSAWAKWPASKNDKNSENIIRGFYPNPVRDLATVKFRVDKPQTLSFVVVNTLGQSRMMYDQKNYQPGDHQLDLALSDLAPGAYFLLVKSNSGVSTVKFIK